MKGKQCWVERVSRRCCDSAWVECTQKEMAELGHQTELSLLFPIALEPCRSREAVVEKAFQVSSISGC